MVKFAEMPPAHPTCHLVRASIPRCRDGGRHVPALRYWFDIPLGIQSWIKEGSRLVLHLAVRTGDKKGMCGETWGSCTETSWGRGRALGFNSLFISCPLQRRARVSYLYNCDKAASVLGSFRNSSADLISARTRTCHPLVPRRPHPPNSRHPLPRDHAEHCEQVLLP